MGSSSGQGAGSSPTASAALEEAVAALEETRDEVLQGIVAKMTEAPEAGSVDDLDAAMARISDLMAVLMGAASASDSQELPSHYRRAVEDYYRALSDDE